MANYWYVIFLAKFTLSKHQWKYFINLSRVKICPIELNKMKINVQFLMILFSKILKKK